MIPSVLNTGAAVGPATFVDAITAPPLSASFAAEYVICAIPEPGFPSGPFGSVPEKVTVVLAFSHPAAFSAGDTPAVEGFGFVRSTFTANVYSCESLPAASVTWNFTTLRPSPTANAGTSSSAPALGFPLTATAVPETSVSAPFTEYITCVMPELGPTSLAMMVSIGTELCQPAAFCAGLAEIVAVGLTESIPTGNNPLTATLPARSLAVTLNVVTPSRPSDSVIGGLPTAG